MSWCWVRCFMLRHSRLTSLVNSPCIGPPQRRRLPGRCAEAPRLFGALCVFAAWLVLFGLSAGANAQALPGRANDIRAAMDLRDFERAEALVRELRAADADGFARNN